MWAEIKAGRDEMKVDLEGMNITVKAAKKVWRLQWTPFNHVWKRQSNIGWKTPWYLSTSGSRTTGRHCT
jgi:hypothetical protein